MNKIQQYIGIPAFLLVLLTMPIGHALMIGMEKLLGHEWLYVSAFSLGMLGIVFLLLGLRSQRDTPSTFWGLFAALFFWTGWVEFGFVYFAHRFGVQPLLEGGEVVTKPEYLIMPSSVGFFVVIVLFYTLRVQSGCSFFRWIQKNLFRMPLQTFKGINRQVAFVTFMEMILLLWASYLVLLFCYDQDFLGDHHPVTALVALGSLLWSTALFIRLLRIRKLGYAIRYAIPVVIIFWTFVEILGRWNLLKEVWVEPFEHLFEMSLIIISFLLLLGIVLMERRSKQVS